MTFSFILNKTRRNIVKNQKKSREIAFLLFKVGFIPVFFDLFF
jgi:hypothetical protein